MKLSIIGNRRVCLILRSLLVAGLAIQMGLPLAAQQAPAPQDPAEAPRTRTEAIEAARDQKAAALQPDEPNKWERIFSRIKDEKTLERLTAGYAGFRIKFGGLAPGAGFAVGPEYFRDDFGEGSFILRSAAQMSFTGAQKLDLELSAPRLANERVELSFQAVRHNYPRLNYYGPGPDSEKTGRSNFRLEDTTVDTTLTLKPVRFVKLGSSVGYIFVNAGPGTNDRLISSEQQYSPAVTPGIDVQADAFRWGVFGQIDYRDNPGGPRSGGSYTVQYNDYDDQDLNRFDFSRLTVDLQQYLPIFNKRRVIALRARTNHSFVRNGQAVPFYLQNVLGGNSDLRGYRPFRFFGDNSMLMNAEWRWEVFSGMDMALFADAGKVFQHHTDFNFKNLESTVGAGMRFNARNSTFIRIDVGFSHEGYQVWFSFGDAFAQALQRTSSNFAIQ